MTSDRPMAFITGGTSGIGRAAALAFAAAGYDVLATGLIDDEIQACRADSAFAGVHIVHLDVGDPDAVRREISERPRLDVLVNAAGISRVADEFSESGFQRLVDVNLFGTMRCCYAARALLARRGGAIVNLASTMSVFGSQTAPAYAASKGAVVQFTKSLALAWAAESIRCNAVAPGWIDTAMTRSLRQNEARYQRVMSRTPLARLGLPAEIADAIVFLASPRASFITGTVLTVDGGYSAHGL